MGGASASLRAQAGIAQNLANANTVGFQAVLSGAVAAPGNGDGFPSRASVTSRDFGSSSAPGAAIHTGAPMDVRLDQSRWLAIQDSSGDVAYTRAGDLQVTPNGMVVTGTGRPVLGADGAPLALPPYQSVSIAGDGTISVVPQGQPASTITEAGRLQLAAINPGDMTRGDDGLMRPRLGVQAQPAVGKSLTAGALEGSNVDASSMLVSMIEVARKFEMQVNLLKTGDEMSKASTSLLSSR